MGKSKTTTHWLLKAGIASGILFIGVSLVLGFIVPGFNFVSMPISVLLLGNLGWIQFINFEISGLLAILFALGIWRFRLGKSMQVASVLLGVYGLGIIIAGLNHPDPEFGFPPGAPMGEPTTMSTSGTIHGLAFFSLVIVIIVASSLFARRFAKLKQKGWMWYSIATALSVPVLLVVGIALSASNKGGLPLFGVGTVMSLWIIFTAKHLLKILHKK